MMVCAVLLTIGGVVSWLTIRNRVLEPPEPTPADLDGSGPGALG